MDGLNTKLHFPSDRFSSSFTALWMGKKKQMKGDGRDQNEIEVEKATCFSWPNWEFVASRLPNLELTDCQSKGGKEFWRKIDSNSCWNSGRWVETRCAARTTHAHTLSASLIWCKRLSYSLSLPLYLLSIQWHSVAKTMGNHCRQKLQEQGSSSNPNQFEFSNEEIMCRFGGTTTVAHGLHMIGSECSPPSELVMGVVVIWCLMLFLLLFLSLFFFYVDVDKMSIRKTDFIIWTIPSYESLVWLTDLGTPSPSRAPLLPIMPCVCCFFTLAIWVLVGMSTWIRGRNSSIRFLY